MIYGFTWRVMSLAMTSSGNMSGLVDAHCATLIKDPPRDRREITTPSHQTPVTHSGAVPENAIGETNKRGATLSPISIDL